MPEELTREEVVEVVDRVIADLLRAAGTGAPPVDAIALAQGHLKMVVCLDRRQEQRGRAQRAAGRKQIFLRPEPSEERHQWTVAHEIGEHLKAGVMERGQLSYPGTGTPQGGVISPLLSNVFLHYVLDLWVHHHWRKRKARGRVIVVRYADDFVMGFQYADDAAGALAARIQSNSIPGAIRHDRLLPP